jgi:cell division protein FtsB
VRPVSGFERPAIQWLFVLLGLVLIAVTGGAAWHARRTAAATAQLQANEEQARMEAQRLDAQLARERSTREALALELSRLRAGGDAELPRTMPTLTLMPAETRGPTPPAPSVTAQHATQVIEVRLLLPRGEHSQYARFEVVLRDWSGGDVLWSRGGLVRSAIEGRAAATAFLTGDVLRAGSYELLLSGVTRDGKKDEVATYEVAVK